MWRPCTDAHAHMLTRAGRFAHQHTPAHRTSRVSEQAVSMSTPTRGHCLHATPQALPHHSPPPLQQAHCLRPPASRGSWKWEEEGAQSGLGLAGLRCPGTPAMPRQCDSYRSVLALGTVPGRLMSRSLRLMKEKEGQCEAMGRCCHQCHSTRAGALPALESSTQPHCPGTLWMEDPMAISAMTQADPAPRDAE